MPNREMVNSYYIMDFYIDIKKNGDLNSLDSGKVNGVESHSRV